VSATQVIAYADDIALITRDKKSLGAALQKLVTETEKEVYNSTKIRLNT
jgi:hypothetical protein